MKKNKVLKKVGNVIFYSLMAILLVIGIYSKMNNEIPSFFGYSFMHVISGSMEPYIMTNDVAIGKKLNPDSEIIVGDVYIYDDLYGRKIIHRIIEQNEDATYVFKGDNNSTRDYLDVDRSQLEFHYLFKIPKLGYLVILLKNKYFYAALIAIIMAVELLSYIKKKTTKDTETK